MALPTASDNEFPKVILEEVANDGSATVTPAADHRALFLGEDGALHLKDSAAAVTDIGGSGDVATDAIWDAKGDLAVGTGANTAQKLTAGANGLYLRTDSGETTGLEWAALPAEIGIACSDETTAIVAATAKASFRMPYAMTVTAVRASLKTAATSGTFTVDINDGGTTILSTKLTIDATEKTSTTAATPAVISDTALADDAEITIDVDDDAAGDATGLKVWIIGTRV